MSMHLDQSAVTVLGLGPMGRALAGAFLEAGLRTTVWNRTPGRDADLLARGAAGARSAEEAVAASALTVICVVNDDAVDAVLRRDAVAAALKGRTVVNLSADTPERARDLADWAAGHGVRYLDGAIMTPNTTIGTPAAVFLHAGPADLYAEHRTVLEALGGTHTHLGEDIGRAAAYDTALPASRLVGGLPLPAGAGGAGGRRAHRPRHPVISPSPPPPSAPARCAGWRRRTAPSSAGSSAPPPRTSNPSRC
ncbi:2-hydroxy-3-oxopropionate reductase [Streptomyces griseoloalbus]